MKNIQIQIKQRKISIKYMINLLYYTLFMHICKEKTNKNCIKMYININIFLYMPNKQQTLSALIGTKSVFILIFIFLIIRLINTRSKTWEAFSSCNPKVNSHRCKDTNRKALHVHREHKPLQCHLPNVCRKSRRFSAR